MIRSMGISIPLNPFHLFPTPHMFFMFFIVRYVIPDYLLPGENIAL